MDFALTSDQQEIIGQVRRIAEKFDDAYWLARDADGIFPHEFHGAFAEAGFLGITMPTAFGGAGLGVTEAALMMRTITEAGGGMTAASSLHINLFGPHPIKVAGTPEQQRRWIPRLVAGKDKVAFGVTEPDAGLDTTAITTKAERIAGGYRISGRKMWTSTAQVATKFMLLARTTPRAETNKPTEGLTLFYTDFDRTRIDAKRIPKMGRHAVDSNAVFIDGLEVPEEDRVGAEGEGFKLLLHSLNPERILIGMEAIGIGRNALARAARYAKDRRVFGRAIGQNQSIQHPLAENWAALQAADLLAMKAAWAYDQGLPCGADANAAKLLGARAGYDACLQSVMTHGGMGYAKEFQAERLLREVMITRLAPVSEQLILSYIAEQELDLPKSY